jgi:hypothetical protein
MNKVTKITFIFLLVIGAGLAEIRKVPEDYPTSHGIQAAVDHAHRGDTISVWLMNAAPDTYDYINFQGESIYVVNRSYIENIPYYPPSPDYICIDGGNVTSAVYFVSGEDSFAILRGFTIQNGTGENNDNNEGGGILCFQSSPKIEDNIIKENWDDDTYRGGGIAIIGNGSNYDLTRPIISDNVIRDNRAGEIGGGIYYNYAHPVIVNNKIVMNSVSLYGGGIGSYSDASGSFWTQIMDNQIDSNAADYNRGRALNLGESNALIRNNTIRHNKESNPSLWAGIFCPNIVDFGDAGGANGPGYNWIEDNGTYDILSSGDGLMAEGNYWATLNTHDIRNRIYPGSGSVDFDPIAASDRIFSVDNTSQCSTDVIVTGDLTVNSEATLTIAPGKTFKFATTPDCTTATGSSASLCELLINGKLHAHGNQNNKITFTSFATSPQPGDWYGVALKSGSKGDFVHSILKYAYSAIDAGENSHLTVDTSTLKRNQVHGIKIWGADSIAIKKSEIDSSIYSIYSNQSPVIVNDNKIKNNFRYGIILENTDSSNVEKNQIAAGTTSPTVDTALYGISLSWVGGKVSVKSNRIENWYQSGIRCYETKAKFKYDTLSNNHHYGMFCEHHDSSYVRRCRIEKNNVAGVRCESYSFPNLGIAPDSGNNSIDTNNTRWVENYNSMLCDSVKAELNWWGMANPTLLARTKFYGAVDYIPYLTSEPRGGGQSANTFKPTPTFALYMPRPNPAKNVVRIAYSLPNRCKSELIICDILGRIITNITEDKDAGSYEYFWKGKDQRGKEVSNGIYIVRLKAENNIKTQKIALAR